MQNLNLESRSRCRSRFKYRSRPRNVFGFSSGSFRFLLLCGVVKAHGNSTIIADLDLDQGFNTSETSLRSLAVGEPCSESEYDNNYMCSPNWDIGDRCTINDASNGYYESIEICKDEHRGYLMEIKTPYQQKRIGSYVNRNYAWLAMRLINGIWRWKRGNKEVEQFFWQPGQPDMAQAGSWCAATNNLGWNDYPCGWAYLTNCHIRDINHPEDFDSIGPQGQIEPSSKYLRYGEEFTVTCTGYYLWQGKLFVQVDQADGTLVASYDHENKCGSQHCITALYYTYHRGNWKCIRQSTLTVTLSMSRELNGYKWACGVKSRDSTRNFYINTLYYSHEPSRPFLSTSDIDLEVEIGQQLGWTCNNKLGSDEFGTIALISFYNCGNWVSQANFVSRQPESIVERSSLTCARLIDVLSDQSIAAGNILVMYARLKVTSYLEGAILACFSYGAIKKFRSGLRKDEADTLAVYSRPIKITYKPAVPQLTIKYHAQPPNVYKNVKLWAVCDAQVGTGGGIMWTLKSSTGREDFRTELGGEPPDTPPNIEIDTFPKKCPENWVGSIASGTCIKVSETATSWEDARRICQEDNSDLVRILNSETLGFLDSILGADGYWIGLNDLDGDGKFNWLDNPRFKAKFSSWRTLVSRTMEFKWCVYMHGRKWYALGCKYRLRAVCETAPGSYFSDYKYDRRNLPEMRSVFTVIINKSLEFATLECQVTSPSINTDGLKDESMPFTLIESPIYSAEWLETYHNQIAYLKCASYVFNGNMSLAIFSRKELKYLYVIDAEREVKPIEPAAKFKVTKFEVNAQVKGISIQATLETDELLDEPSMMCFPYEVDANDIFNFDPEVTQNHNKEYSVSVPKGVDWALIALVILSFLVVAVAVLLSSKASSKLQSGAAEGDEEKSGNKIMEPSKRL